MQVCVHVSLSLCVCVEQPCICTLLMMVVFNRNVTQPETGTFPSVSLHLTIVFPGDVYERHCCSDLLRIRSSIYVQFRWLDLTHLLILFRLLSWIKFISSCGQEHLVLSPLRGLLVLLTTLHTWSSYLLAVHSLPSHM